MLDQKNFQPCTACSHCMHGYNFLLATIKVSGFNLSKSRVLTVYNIKLFEFHIFAVRTVSYRNAKSNFTCNPYQCVSSSDVLE